MPFVYDAQPSRRTDRRIHLAIRSRCSLAPISKV
jgi:hypothetical protein